MEKAQYFPRREPANLFEQRIATVAQSLCQTATCRSELIVPLDAEIETLTHEMEETVFWDFDQDSNVLLMDSESDTFGFIVLPITWE